VLLADALSFRMASTSFTAALVSGVLFASSWIRSFAGTRSITAVPPDLRRGYRVDAAGNVFAGGTTADPNFR